MKKRVMDSSRILKELRKFAQKSIDILNQSRGARSSYEAGELRRRLQEILAGKENCSEKEFTEKLIFALKDAAEFFKDKERSFKSEKFKKLGDEISGFLDGF
jgi:hypothetical protein